MLTVISFIFALALLIAIHEYGHYRVAVACGVKVLRFSVGFGKPLLTWKPKNQHPGQDTEFVIAAFPLGGYVRMLDEREEAVPPELRHMAFNTQPLASRVAIVAAGPIANLLLAVFLYACVNWIGMQEPRAIVARPATASVAAQVGIVGGEQIEAASVLGQALREVRSMEDLRWLLTQAALDGQDVQLQVRNVPTNRVRELVLPLSQMSARDADAQLFQRIGLGLAWTRPLIGDLVLGGAGERSGLKKNDLVESIAGVPVLDGAQLREAIRSAVAPGGEKQTQLWRVLRRGQMLPIEVTADVVKDGEAWIGRIGAYVGSAPEMTQVRYGLVDGLWRGVVKTWQISALTLRMMGKMVIGEASLKNLSGPITIADVAGKSASLGVIQYLLFLALISVSLGVLNLLPLPVLDGGHLMYYLWEAVVGKAPSDVWLERLQRGGVAVLMAMMCIALFNDVTRIFG